MTISPVALFVYNRPEHTKQTIEALKNNELASQTDLIIFSDAPKNDQAKEAVKNVRSYIRTITGFKNISIFERDINHGLAKSIINGVTEIVNKYGKIIVLEDDLITSPYFLKYMNEALDTYEKEEKIISIHGYSYPCKEELPETYFIKGADCWGWATWKRGWDLFEADGKKLLEEIRSKKLSKTFDLNGAYPYTQMLESQVYRLNNSWAIRWYASAFLKDKLTLYPGRSLVSNIGFDDSGTHTGSNKFFQVNISDRPVTIGNIPIEENRKALEAIIKYFKSPKLFLFVKYLRIKNMIKIARLKSKS
ncbi:MAG: hypothetical protein UT48_C0012G0029 [Parcubacteria group bacterium GW2011_GWE2_39_37]|uniref:Glycosyltransferase 2-like domain-containing protein n=1 Tax=Candidatus Falkowbacteria bacterium GW2011_GWF2_39_8 TaxID=1618642 RepID=A0A0G0PUZ2_9BACT|nr:MAG: hypothetical protein UT48_C0012G0029 [Parcubacteria group bacterium GW2011_GWE2_39_37]KKR31713.1 MAG: hypothetical protein UT64_C0053G0004 [Candidatus Falkowbacteria bacterium GW2011_GWF2_39_8]